MKKFITIIIILHILINLTSTNSPELLYQKAMSATDEEIFLPLLNQLATTYKNTSYGQKALLELAKIHYLKRNYQKALEYLKQIRDKNMNENIYWLAKTYLKLNKNIQAIYSAQNYIYLAPNDLNKDEDMLLTIAEAFMQKKLYNKALATLNSLRKSKYATNRISLIVFKTGECYEKMGKIEKAIKIYKKMKIDFPYDEYTYIAQDKIYELTSLDTLFLSEKKTKKLDKASVSPNNFDLYLQAGAYQNKKMATIQKNKIISLGIKAKIRKKIKHGKELFVVYAGPFENTTSMQKATVKLKKNNIEFFIYKKYHK